MRLGAFACAFAWLLSLPSTCLALLLLLLLALLLIYTFYYVCVRRWQKQSLQFSLPLTWP